MKLLHIPPKIAAQFILGLGAAVLVLHAGVLARLIPPQLVWGGHAAGTRWLDLLESVAFLITAALMALVAMRVGYLKRRLSAKATARVLRLLAAFFVVNTVANLLSSHTLESCLLAPLTLLSALASYRLALDD